MPAKDFRDMPDTELTGHIASLRRELFGLRFANATGELENTAGLPQARRELARALTVARERSLTAAQASGVENHQ
jgi:large subunit ribosomal protein L29